MSRTLRVVLDTNVIVSAMLWQGRPGDLFALAGEGEIALYATASTSRHGQTSLPCAARNYGFEIAKTGPETRIQTCQIGKLAT